MDTGDFLVTGYIHIVGGGLVLAYPLGFLGFLLVKFLDCPRISLGCFWLPLRITLGSTKFCNYKHPCKLL